MTGREHVQVPTTDILVDGDIYEPRINAFLPTVVIDIIQQAVAPVENGLQRRSPIDLERLPQRYLSVMMGVAKPASFWLSDSRALEGT